MLSILADMAPSKELPFTSRLSLCNKDPVEWVQFWIAWEVLKPPQEQTDPLNIWAVSLAVSSTGISGESFVLVKVIYLSAVTIQMR